MLCGSFHAQADPTPSSTPDSSVESSAPTVEEVVINARVFGPTRPVDSRIAEAREEYAGSVATVSPAELERQKTNNLGEVLARVPGVAYVDEDGRGTKLDLSLRGLDPIRSNFVQLLLDGVPIQPSLYSEQAAYYGVPAERLAGIEIFKGGAGVLFGPNTVGGAVNFISRPPSPRPFAAVLDTRFDTYGDYSANIFASGTQGKVFAGVEYLHKGGDGFRDSLGYTIDDADLRVGYRFNDDHWAQIHFQYYDEESETPGGLLPAQLQADRTQSNKPNDEFFGERIALDFRSSHRLTERQQLDLLLYAFQFERNWFLQNYVSDSTANLALANNNAQFLRKFIVIGVRAKVYGDLRSGSDHGP